MCIYIDIWLTFIQEAVANNINVFTPVSGLWDQSLTPAIGKWHLQNAAGNCHLCMHVMQTLELMLILLYSCLDLVIHSGNSIYGINISRYGTNNKVSAVGSQF